MEKETLKCSEGWKKELPEGAWGSAGQENLTRVDQITRKDVRDVNKREQKPEPYVPYRCILSILG